MGDLPTLEDVVNQKLAKLEDYSKARDIIKSELNRLHKRGKIYGAAFYGSITSKQIRVGSDIDILIIAYSINSCMDDLCALHSKIEDMHINAEINPLLSLRQAESGYNAMESFFFDYLRQAISQDDKMGNDPFSILKANQWDKANQWEISPALEFILRHEKGLRILARGCVYPLYGEQHCKFLSRMLNYTIFIPMDMYVVKHAKPYDQSYAKPALVELYKEEFPEIDATALDNALLFWKETNNILKQEKVNPDDYKKILSWFSKQYDSIERFTLDNIKLAEGFKDKY